MGNEYSSSINFKNNFFFCNVISHFLENHQELIAINRAVIWLSLEQQNMRLTLGMGSAGCWSVSVVSASSKGLLPTAQTEEAGQAADKEEGSEEIPTASHIQIHVMEQKHTTQVHVGSCKFSNENKALQEKLYKP